MSLILPTSITTGGVDIIAVQWTPMKFGDTAQPIVSGALVDHSIQCEGLFGAGTNIQIQGSNDGQNYHALTDPYSNTINMGSAQLRQTTEDTVWIKPVISAGDGTANLTITVCIRR